MADGHVELTLDQIKSQEGIATLNRMLRDLYNFVAGDGETRRVFNGSGTPEGAVTADVGSIYMRSDGGAATSIYVKESGTGATGWVAK